MVGCAIVIDLDVHAFGTWGGDKERVFRDDQLVVAEVYWEGCISSTVRLINPYAITCTHTRDYLFTDLLLLLAIVSVMHLMGLLLLRSISSTLVGTVI